MAKGPRRRRFELRAPSGRAAAASGRTAVERSTARELVERLNQDAERIAARFELRYRSIEAERSNVKRRYGVCFSDGAIRIRLRHAVTGRTLKYSSLVNTLCHELAHLRHFDHGLRFRALYLRILEHARAEGIYRPGPDRRVAAPRPAGAAPPRRPRLPEEASAPRGPVQLALF